MANENGCNGCVLQLSSSSLGRSNSDDDWTGAVKTRIFPHSPSFFRRTIDNFLHEVKKPINEIVILRENGKYTLKCCSDWTSSNHADEHLWVSMTHSHEACYVPEENCCKSGYRIKCSACSIVCHVNCISFLMDRMQCVCKSTFCDQTIRNYRESTATTHHWVHMRQHSGKCAHCNKMITAKFSMSSRENVAVLCAWCKICYHNKQSCFAPERFNEVCDFGQHNMIIVPPSWIIKLPQSGQFKSSLKIPESIKIQSLTTSQERQLHLKQAKTFVVKPIPASDITPLLVFLNPKSGGNQGVKLLGMFQWLLNPRQVFDITKGGPKLGLELFKNVSNFKILACGGDGTVGWILAVLDSMNLDYCPPIGVLPLGTGNDLARTLGWGGGYMDEPITKILTNITNGALQAFDRWHVEVEPNSDGERVEPGRDSLPLNVINNYLSLGVDAHIALTFHEAREANPHKFNSRLRNKMFYAQAGGKDLLKREWRYLSDSVRICCDGVDVTHKLKEHRVHSILFLNIPSYGGGTHPWPGRDQSVCDGLIEVIGLTTYHLPLLHAGCHGYPLAKCKEAEITTFSTIPVQVDGEACRVHPSRILLRHLNVVQMIAKRRSKYSSIIRQPVHKLNLDVHLVHMKDYIRYNNAHSDEIATKAVFMFVLSAEIDIDLEQMRHLINQLDRERGCSLSASPSAVWYFLDSCTADQWFRIDKAQEHLYYAIDISVKSMYLLLCNENDDIIDEDDGQSSNISYLSPVLQSNQIKEDIDLCFPGKIGLTNESRIFEFAAKDDIKEMEKLRKQNVDLFALNTRGQTTLHTACSCGLMNMVRYLLTHSSRLAVNHVDSQLQTALHVSATRGHHQICALLLASGANLTLRDCHQDTARDLAIEHGHRRLAEYLHCQEMLQKFIPNNQSTI